MLTTNLYMQQLLHGDHLVAIQQAVQDARRLRQVEGRRAHRGPIQQVARRAWQLSGVLALVLVLLR